MFQIASFSKIFVSVERKFIIFDSASGVLEAIFMWFTILTFYDTEI